ncbi:MAG TPA: di-heme oxidoredictase family protein [Kofleriaceae bacterium]|nr:di-heme oxidoredictase family protein [Kofleriaceae bacterium]
MRVALLVSVLVAGCGEAPARPRTVPWSEPRYFLDEPRTGGATTVDDTSPRGLGRVVNNLAPERWNDVLAGKQVFQRVWRPTPAPGPGAGLGPLYNAASCSGCHFLDGRGGPPSEVTPDVRLLARLAVGGAGDPIYGGQLSELAEVGLPSEGRLVVDYAPRPVLLPDGTAIATRRPVYRWEGAPWGAASPDVALSPRMPAALAGLGLLEAIAAEDLVAAADPDDRDGDGISGRVSWVPDAVTGRRVLGRFGWKASQPMVEQQIATAFREDMGLTSWVHPDGACTPHQRACRDRDGAEEVSRRDLAVITDYVRLLAVPRRREPSAPEVRRGRELFLGIGCAGCHTPRHTTGEHPQLPELSRQTIYPYTDLLLHDMGDELADGVREHEAAGREWRTPPLWGLGLLRSIHGRLRLLHDGRARSVEEAVLWHGGEARGAGRRYEALATGERAMVVRFVESL